MKRKIVIFSDYYVPAFKAGGPVRSIQSICDALGDSFEIYVVTRNKDLGSQEPFEAALFNKKNWTKVGKVRVLYLSEKSVKLGLIRKIISNVNPNVIHLNSLLSIRFSLLPLICMRIFNLTNIKILLSPRGELSAGALELSKYKKILYLIFLRASSLLKNVEWIASSAHESNDIQSNLNIDNHCINFIENLPNIKQWERELQRKESKGKDSLNLLFYGRIARMKNLHYILNILQTIDFKVTFDIYGPAEDVLYLKECQDLIVKLPPIVNVNFKGAVNSDNVYKIIKEYDLFILPTLGENFGQAIWEAFASAVPVLISDKTPWRDLKVKNIGWELELSKPEDFRKCIELIYEMGESEHRSMRMNCRNFAIKYVEEINSKEKLALCYSS